MKILLIGGGGREHAIAHTLVASPRLEQLYVAPGNAGTATLPKTQNVDIAAMAFGELVAFARERAVDLTVVGPEAPLVAGIVDRFRAAELPIFGPTQAAAQIAGVRSRARHPRDLPPMIEPLIRCKQRVRNADQWCPHCQEFRRNSASLRSHGS